MMDESAGHRTIAIVTYFFPPLGGVGVQRMLKYATYLPKSGWRPIVFTPRDPAYEITDPDLLNVVPLSLEVRRSFILEPGSVYGLLMPLLRRPPQTLLKTSSRVMTSSDAPGRRAGATITVRHVAGWPLRTLQTVTRLLFFPDEQLLWIPFAVRSIRIASRTNPHDAILSSSPPITTHLIAGIARKKEIPWVADFRDPWIGNAFAPRLPWLHRQLRKRIERWIVEGADRSVFAATSVRNAYALRYPDLADRFVTLTNGYDRHDFPDPFETATPASPVYRIVYGGSLYGERELGLFLDGLRRLLDRRPTLRDELRIEFVGWLSRSNRVLAEEACKSGPLSDVLSFVGFRPREDALRRVAAADCGLLILADDPGKAFIQPAKMFEYIGMDRQILAIVPAGEVEDVLRGLGWGVVVRPEPDAIAAGIEAVMDARSPLGQADPKGQFDRVVLAEKLAGILDDVSIKLGDSKGNA